MEVVLKVPTDILRYIQYIPEEQLPEIIWGIVREHILSFECTGDYEEKESNPQPVNELDKSALSQLIMDSLQEVLKTQTVVANVQQVQTVSSVEDTEVSFDYIKEDLTFDDSEDFDDLLNLMK